jgi:hypothetical protein
MAEGNGAMTARPESPIHSAEALDIFAPNGDEAVKIACHCTTCGERGIAATVRKVYADQHNLGAQAEDAYTHIHNLVLMASSPLANAPQVRANGPWVA